MGLLEEEELVKRSTPLDTLTHLLANKLAFREYFSLKITQIFNQKIDLLILVDSFVFWNFSSLKSKLKLVFLYHVQFFSDESCIKYNKYIFFI